MLELGDINACYGPVRALWGIVLRIETGSIVSVSGDRGAGKSTLLKVISGLMQPSGGVIRFQGRDITPSSTMETVRLGISQVPEGGRLFTHLSVLDNLQLGAYFYNNRKFKPDIEERLAWVYQIFPPLRRLSNQMAGTLGREERQMAAIGRALMARPKLLLLDEPSQGLSPPAIRKIFRMVRRLNDDGITILLAEENCRGAREIAHYGYRLAAGVLLQEGAAEDLPAGRERSSAESVRSHRFGLDDPKAIHFHET